jgi:hypothetical protein
MENSLRAELEQAIKSHLSDDDDPKFWHVALDTLLTDIDLLKPEQCRKHEIFLQIGACSHYFRPNQARWTDGGGFAWPMGYIQKFQPGFGSQQGPIGTGLPELDWFVLVHLERPANKWQIVEPRFLGKRKLVFRAALPTRTRQHPQGAIHTIWVPGSPKRPDQKLECFYGLRKVHEQWKCVATSPSFEKLVADVGAA